MQHASIHLREARSAQSLLPSSADDPITNSDPAFYTLSSADVDVLETELEKESLKCKKDWFGFNGGDATGTVDRQAYKKPLFFDIALNYAELNMDRLQERAGKKVSQAPSAIVAPQSQRATFETANVDQERAKSAVSRAKLEEIERPMTPEPTANAAKGGLGSLLGGWWGRQ